jgi:hypothetical protein
MLLPVLEKGGFVTTVLVLQNQQRISPLDARAVGPDLVLAVLFVIGFARTRAAKKHELVAGHASAW